jgi:hypothetical protein
VNSVTPSASRLQDRIVVAFFGLTGEDPRQRSIECQCGALLKKSDTASLSTQAPIAVDSSKKPRPIMYMSFPPQSTS